MLFCYFQSIYFFIYLRLFLLWGKVGSLFQLRQGRSKVTPTPVDNAERQTNTPIFMPAGDLHTIINPKCVCLSLEERRKSCRPQRCASNTKCTVPRIWVRAFPLYGSNKSYLNANSESHRLLCCFCQCNWRYRKDEASGFELRWWCWD